MCLELAFLLMAIELDGKYGEILGDRLRYSHSKHRQMKMQFGYLEDMDGDSYKDAVVITKNIKGSMQQKNLLDMQNLWRCLM